MKTLLLILLLTIPVFADWDIEEISKQELEDGSIMEVYYARGKNIHHLDGFSIKTNIEHLIHVEANHRRSVLYLMFFEQMSFGMYCTFPPADGRDEFQITLIGKPPEGK